MINILMNQKRGLNRFSKLPDADDGDIWAPNNPEQKKNISWTPVRQILCTQKEEEKEQQQQQQLKASRLSFYSRGTQSMANITPKFFLMLQSLQTIYIKLKNVFCEVVKRLPYQLANIKIISLTIFIW